MLCWKISPAWVFNLFKLTLLAELRFTGTAVLSSPEFRELERARYNQAKQKAVVLSSLARVEEDSIVRLSSG